MFGSSASSSSRALARSAALAALLSAARPGGLAPQVPPPARDTLARADTTPRADTTARVDSAAALLVPVLPSQTPPGPLPVGARLVFDLDTLDWSGALTVADLLAHVPGVYVARTGSYGQAEVIMFGGRGARALEIYRDGIPLDPVGRDSLYADATYLSLAFLERVEVLVRPAGLRVDLVSRRQGSRETFSSVLVRRGQYDAAGYRAMLFHRYRSGAGLAVGAEATASDGETAASVFEGLSLFLRAEYLPSPRAGAALQVVRSAADRRGGPLESGAAISARDVTWRQQQLSLFVDRRTEGRGWRVDALVGSWSAEGDSGISGQTLRHAALGATYRAPTWSSGATLRLRSARTPLEIEALASWAPWQPLALSLRGDVAWHEADRVGARLTGAASLRLPAGFWLRGTVERSDGPQAPAVSSDSGVGTTDAAGYVGWALRWARLEAGLVNRAPYAPFAPPEIAGVSALAPSVGSDYFALRGSISPVPGLTIGGWLEHPRSGHADFAPPYHGVAAATFRSKFWRVFRSGVFDVKLEGRLESWSTGTAGLDAGAAPITLKGATFIHLMAAVQVVGFHFFWQVRNLGLAEEGYVPGYPYGGSIQTFGARWAFTN